MPIPPFGGAPYKLTTAKVVTVAAPGLLLAVTQYGPASLQTYSTSSSTMTAVDTTNLTVGPFTVPVSGRILVRLTATTSAANLWWGLLNHSGGAQLGFSLGFYAGNVGQSAPVLITGLTPGASLQLDWGFASQSGTAGFYAFGGTLNTAGHTAPAVMEVWAA